MAFTFDVATDRGKVRLLITDTDENNYIFEDDEIDAFLSMTAVGGENVVPYAAALALETIAKSQVLVLKVIRLQDLQTDGASVARELRLQADRLRQMVDNEPDFDWAEMSLDPNVIGEIIWNDALREQG